MVRVDESDTGSGRQQVWMLSRNCALTPRQLGAFYLSLVAASFAIATACLVQGAWMVVPFSVVEMLAVGVALLVYARHAVDCERVSLAADALVIESYEGNSRRVARFDPRAARVVTEQKPRGTVAVVASGERILVGRFVTDRERRRFAVELRRALSGTSR